MISKNTLSKIVIVFALLLWPINFLLSDGFRNFTKSFPQTVFTYDYQARQLILRNTYLYPNVFMARIFQNKLNIPVIKFENNLFSLLDPNYYFFSSHPRKMYNNQNLAKFPFVLIIFLLYGLLKITGLKNYKKIGTFFFLSVATLSLLISLDIFDLILWPVFCVVIFHGYRLFNKKYPPVANSTIVIIFIVTVIEYLRLIAKT